jgi:hypothetical protein
MFQSVISALSSFSRVIAIVSGLLLAACAPMALPGAEAVLQPGAPEDPQVMIIVAQQEAEFTGTLTAKEGNVWVVNGFRVTLTAQTEVKGNPQIGDTVKVHGTPQSDGSIVAREIEVVLPARTATPTSSATASPSPTATAPEPTNTPTAPSQAKIEFVGQVTAMNNGEWTVAGFRVTVTAQTEIKGNPQVGSTVKVEGRLQADGSVLAREIEALPAVTRTPIAGHEVEFTGTLTAINGQVWTVNGVRVTVTAQTEIKGNPQVGSTVKVEGRLQADGSVLAREIKKAKGDDDDDRNDNGNGNRNGNGNDDDNRNGNGNRNDNGNDNRNGNDNDDDDDDDGNGNRNGNDDDDDDNDDDDDDHSGKGKP